MIPAKHRGMLPRKPRRGGLFIDEREPNSSSFCFSAALRSAVSLCSQKSGATIRWRQKPWNRAAEKQKEGRMGCNYTINRPPLRGLKTEPHHLRAPALVLDT